MFKPVNTNTKCTYTYSNLIIFMPVNIITESNYAPTTTSDTSVRFLLHFSRIWLIIRMIGIMYYSITITWCLWQTNSHMEIYAINGDIITV